MDGDESGPGALFRGLPSNAVLGELLARWGLPVCSGWTLVQQLEPESRVVESNYWWWLELRWESHQETGVQGKKVPSQGGWRQSRQESGNFRVLCTRSAQKHFWRSITVDMDVSEILYTCGTLARHLDMHWVLTRISQICCSGAASERWLGLLWARNLGLRR